MPDSEKLEAVAEAVAKVRESYGNGKATVPDVKVNTTHGMLPFSHLEDDSKVEMLKNEALKIKAQAIAYVEAVPGSVLNKKVQELIATNSLFANASSESEFDCL